MARNLTRTQTLILGACLSPAIIYFGFKAWQFLIYFTAGAKTLAPNVYVPLGITILTAFLGLLATLITQARTRRREIEAAFRERKISIYLEFLEMLETMQLAQKPELKVKAPDQNELVKTVFKVRTKAILWGSPGVLSSLSKFVKVGKTKPFEMLKVMEEIQLEMRKDLGLSNFGLGEGFFIKLLISNPEELNKLRKNQ